MKHKVYLITPTYTLADQGLSYRTPVDTWTGGVARLVERIAKRADTECVVLLDSPAARRLAFTGENEWETFKFGKGRDQKRIYVGRLADLDGLELVVDRADPATTSAFYLFHSLLGVAYHRSPGVAGLSKLYDMYPRGGKTKPVVWESPQPEDAWESPYYPRDWHRSPDGAYLHGYDKRRAGLAAMSTVEVARYALRHTGRRSFDPKLAGWWKISVPAWNDPRMPHPAGYDAEDRDLRWVTTPTVILLRELAEKGLCDGVTDRDIWDSWTSSASRLFVDWASQVETAYQRAGQIMAAGDEGPWTGSAQDAERVQETLKDVYRQTAGMFTAETSWVARHDWYCSIVAMNRANLWRKAWQVGQVLGRWPVLADGDKLWYASDLDDGEKAVPAWSVGDQVKGFVLGDKLGQFRHDGTREVKGV